MGGLGMINLSVTIKKLFGLPAEVTGSKAKLVTKDDIDNMSVMSTALKEKVYTISTSRSLHITKNALGLVTYAFTYDGTLGATSNETTLFTIPDDEWKPQNNLVMTDPIGFTQTASLPMANYIMLKANGELIFRGAGYGTQSTTSQPTTVFAVEQKSSADVANMIAFSGSLVFSEAINVALLGATQGLVTVNLTVPLPDNNYEVFIEANGNYANWLVPIVEAGTKTSTSFQVREVEAEGDTAGKNIVCKVYRRMGDGVFALETDLYDYENAGSGCEAWYDKIAQKVFYRVNTSSNLSSGSEVILTTFTKDWAKPANNLYLIQKASGTSNDQKLLIAPSGQVRYQTVSTYIWPGIYTAVNSLGMGKTKIIQRVEKDTAPTLIASIPFISGGNGAQLRLFSDGNGVLNFGYANLNGAANNYTTVNAPAAFTSLYEFIPGSATGCAVVQSGSTVDMCYINAMDASSMTFWQSGTNSKSGGFTFKWRYK
jgi:hypothetical protein